MHLQARVMVVAVIKKTCGQIPLGLPRFTSNRPVVVPLHPCWGYMYLQGNVRSLYNTAAGRYGPTQLKPINCEPKREASTISMVGTWCGG